MLNLSLALRPANRVPKIGRSVGRAAASSSFSPIGLALGALLALMGCEPAPSKPSAVRGALVGDPCPCLGANQTCVNSICVCLDGFYDNAGNCSACDNSCATCAGPTADDCTSCSAGAALAAPVGAVCTTNADCALMAVDHSNGGVCTSNACALSACEAGYQVTGSTCTDINECATNNGGCDAQATCGNTAGSFTCTCNAGYTGNGTTCTDVDECTTNNGGCGANATCANTLGGFSCTCNAGFTGDGITCVDVDECATNNGGCDAHASCSNTAGSYLCTCNTGYTGNGTTCADINECATNNGGCDAHATCTNTAGSFTCACNTGYFGNGTSCTVCTTCAAGTFEAAACLGANDTTCTNCTLVANCATATTCTTNSNQQCASCASGYYLTDGTADTCTACTPIAGCNNAVICTNASDQVCTACAAGKFLTGGACLACSNCSIGQYVSAPCTATSNTVCDSCPGVEGCASTVSCTAGTNSRCGACSAGFYMSNGVCHACSVCPAGQYASGACSGSVDTVCTSCTAITGCTSTVTCTTSSDSQCTRCTPERYLVNGTTDSCAPCGTVPNCTSATTCTTATDQKCSSCAAGSYLSNGACVPCSTICPSGQYQSAACTASADRVCSVCAADCLTCSGSATQCTSCAATEYLTAAGKCESCGCDPNATCTVAAGVPSCRCKTNYTGDGHTCTPVCAAGETLCTSVCVSLATDNRNCGRCGNACAGGVNAAGTCVNGSCTTSTACDERYADCKTDPAGCETPINTTADCGKCGSSCAAVLHGAAICAAGACAISSCDPDFGNCDRDGANGCETNLLTDSNNCGTCGTKCEGSACVSGRCANVTCATGFADCRSDVFGCETDTRTFSNCGGCGTACTAIAHGTTECTAAGACAILGCASGYRASMQPDGSLACVVCNGNVDDGDACTLDSCSDTGAPLHTPLSPAQISDDNPCTTDSCSVSVGVQHAIRAGASCGEGALCNAAGQCVTSAAFVSMGPAVVIGQADDAQLRILAGTTGVIVNSDGTTSPLVTITITPTSEFPPRTVVPAMTTAISPIVRLGPSGAKFGPPIAVSLPFEPRRTPTPTGMVSCDDASQCSVLPVSIEGTMATALIEHFSFVFLIAANPAPAGVDGGAPMDAPKMQDGPPATSDARGVIDAPGADAPIALDARPGTDGLVAPDGAADRAPAKTGSGGCSCRTGAAPVAPSAGTLVCVGLIAAALVARRRRRG